MHRRAQFARSFVVVLVAALCAPCSARAQDDVWRYFSARGEITVGGMLPDYQTGSLGYGIGVAGGLHLGVRPIAPLVIQVGASGWYFPSDLGGGSQWLVGGGLRLEPRIGDVGWLVIDGNAGVALTGQLVRFGFDAGIGFELSVGGVVGIGPQIRYGHTVASSDDWPSDAIFVTGGVAISLRGEEPRVVEAIGDRDADGIDDGLDLCPEVAAGATPDPQRNGCPLEDRDSDGVLDAEDLCPTSPAGADPDPARAGCPSLDTDVDGIFDHLDACPTTAAGATPDPQRPGCPDPDSDADGFTDSLDACPSEPPGLRPDRERPGCPAPDRDGDTVPDSDDTCPDMFGAPSPHAERNGCPGLVRVEQGVIRIMRPVFFATGRDTLLARSVPVLQAIADALIATPRIRRLSIEGHTDDVGDDATNIELSMRRAHEVVAWLIQAGVEADRLEAHGFGETQPLVPSTTESARAVNRRVELRIVDPPEGSARGTTADGRSGRGTEREQALREPMMDPAPATEDAPDGARSGT